MESEKKYDLEDRTLRFAKNVRAFVKKLRKTIANVEDSRQLIRASGSIGANYIEANESFSDKDFVFRIKISRKESKESRFWLLLLDCEEKQDLENERQSLVQEATELMKIFGSMVRGKEKAHMQSPKAEA